MTEAAALAAGKWVGRGDGVSAGLAARKAMTGVLARMPIVARVVAGRASAGPADGLSVGELVGGGGEGEGNWDLAVKPLESHDALSKGLDGALSMIAVGPEGSLMSLPEMYMQKMVVGGRAAEAIDIDAEIGGNLEAVAVRPRPESRGPHGRGARPAPS